MASKKEQAEWMLAPHNCNDCVVRVVVLKIDIKETLTLWQCTRCKTIYTKVEDL